MYSLLSSVLTDDEGGNVGNGEVEEVDIGGCPHVLIVEFCTY